MLKIPEEVIDFFENQSFIIVSTLDKSGHAHNSCKGLIRINRDGKVYLLDLYRGITHDNLTRNPKISITAVSEHRFAGYCLKGTATLVGKEGLSPDIKDDWKTRITSRVTQRVIKNIKQGKGHLSHPESKMPDPKYMIIMEATSIVDLSPKHLK